jgi:hypothetical protein
MVTCWISAEHRQYVPFRAIKQGSSFPPLRVPSGAGKCLTSDAFKTCDIQEVPVGQAFALTE